MGYILRREVRDALPAGLLSSAERLLVLEVADHCNDKTREGFPGAEALAEATDLSPRSIQETLSRVAKKWIEIRVPLGVDKFGRPYFSHAGRRTTFRFPALQRRSGATDPGAYGATDPGASEQEGATDPGGRCDGSVSKVRQIRGPSPQLTLKDNTSLTPSSCDADTPAPSTTTTQEEGKISDQPTIEDTAAAIARAYSRDFSFVEEKRLAKPVAAALRRGWTKEAITAELDRPTTGLASVAAGLIGRAKDLGDPPPDAPARKPERPWCGRCDEKSRMLTYESRYGEGMKAMRCPDCHRAAAPPDNGLGKFQPSGLLPVDPHATQPTHEQFVRKWNTQPAEESA